MTQIEEFIEKNKLSMRTQDEIVQKLKDVSIDGTFFGFRQEVLLPCLSLENVKKFIHKNRTVGTPTISDITIVVGAFWDNIGLAFTKVIDQKQISVARSIDRLSAFLWLMGRDDLEELILRKELYYPFGAPALATICDKMGIDAPDEIKAFLPKPPPQKLTFTPEEFNEYTADVIKHALAVAAENSCLQKEGSKIRYMELSSKKTGTWSVNKEAITESFQEIFNRFKV